jgi:hypothetical protein
MDLKPTKLITTLFDGILMGLGFWWDWIGKRVNVKEKMACLNMWRMVVELGERGREGEEECRQSGLSVRIKWKYEEGWVKNIDSPGPDKFNPAKSQDKNYKWVIG